MNAAALLETCRAAGLSLEVDGFDLIVECDRDPPAQLLDELRKRKPEVIAFLSPRAAIVKAEPVSSAADADGDDLDERAALVEVGAGVPRAWARGFAQLDPDRPPLDVPAARWLQFIDDIGRFLDGGFAAQASALGWGPLDLFGCGDTKPFARIDLSGLLWLLAGDRLVALTADTATIEARSGARTTYRRKAAQLGRRVLAWELAP